MKFRNIKIIFFLVPVIIALSCTEKTGKKEIYKDSKAPIEKRVADLLQKMTLEEKIAQLSEAGCDNMKEDNKAETTKFVAKEYKYGIGTIHGFKLNVTEYAKAVNSIQKYLVEDTRLGIPAIFLSESLHGLVQDGASIFPQSIAMASSWNTELEWEIGCAIRKEVKAIGASQVLSPDLDVARELRWGRIEETYGEDPFLASRMGVSMIKGLQEGSLPDGTYLIATAKPFLTYCAPLGGLNLASTPGGWYDLYNTYLPPFRAAIEEANVLSIMSAYNSYDGEALNASKLDHPWEGEFPAIWENGFARKGRNSGFCRLFNGVYDEVDPSAKVACYFGKSVRAGASLEGFAFLKDKLENLPENFDWNEFSKYKQADLRLFANKKRGIRK